MFLSASSFNQQLCWNVTGKYVTDMFTGTNGASVIVCAPSSAPTGAPTGQPTNQPTFLPTSQPTIDTSFKKRSKDMVVDVSDGTKETIQEVRSGMKSMIRGLRRAIQPRGYNNDL